jgi:hypothetical protein
LSGYAATGLLGTDTTATLSGVSASVSGTDAGSYTNAVTASTQTNYTVTTADGALTIAKAPLTITGSSASTTYTGVAQTLSGYAATGLLGTDTTATLSGVSASVSGTDAGSYTNTADVNFRFLPCLASGLSYYIAMKRAPDRIVMLKQIYEEDFLRAAQEDRDIASVYLVPDRTMT